jgi:hypothetical protein
MTKIKFVFEDELDLEEAKRLLKDWDDGEFTDELLDFLNSVMSKLEEKVKEVDA